MTIEYFDKNLDPNLDLASSPALNLTQEQIATLSAQYAKESAYYFKGQPPFVEVLKTIAEIRNALQA